VARRLSEMHLSEEENGVRVIALADRVKRAYANTEFLSFRAEPVWNGKIHGHVQTFMARGRLKTRLLIDGRIAYVLTFQEGTIEEFKPAFNGVREQYEVRAADSPNGTHDLTQLDGIDEYGCMLGGYCQTWVGEEVGKTAFFVKRIRDGHYLGTAELRCEPCDLVLAPPSAQYGGIELIYIRPDGFIVQNDTFAPGKPGSQPRFIRTRPYLDISTAPLPEATWDFERPPTTTPLSPATRPPTPVR
jgi:hypothetical protein